MRRGETAVVFESCSHMGDLYRWFIKFLKLMRKKVGAHACVCVCVWGGRGGGGRSGVAWSRLPHKS